MNDYIYPYSRYRCEQQKYAVSKLRFEYSLFCYRTKLLELFDRFPTEEHKTIYLRILACVPYDFRRCYTEVRREQKLDYQNSDDDVDSDKFISLFEDSITKFEEKWPRFQCHLNWDVLCNWDAMCKVPYV